jgi:hypothetical protein
MDFDPTQPDQEKGLLSVYGLTTLLGDILYFSNFCSDIGHSYTKHLSPSLTTANHRVSPRKHRY